MITYHKALKALDDREILKLAKIERWIERIQNFNSKVEYKKGIEILRVDALSRVANKKEINLVTLNTENMTD